MNARLVAVVTVLVVSVGIVIGVLIVRGTSRSPPHRQVSSASGHGERALESKSKSRRVYVPTPERHLGDGLSEPLEAGPVVTQAAAEADQEEKRNDAWRQDPDTAAKQLVQTVRSEPRDGVWARENESNIRDTLDEVIRAETGVQVSGVFCGSMRCVVEGSAVSRRKFSRVAPTIQAMPGMKQVRIRLTRKDDRTLEYRAVLAREGFNIYGEPLAPKPPSRGRTEQ